MNATQTVNHTALEQFFTDIGTQMELTQPQINGPELNKFFTTVSHQVELAEEQQRLINKREATEFNIFDLIEPDENKLSDIIADLLDPKGSHGQGDLFLLLLFKQLGRSLDAKYTKNATVQREAPTHGILKYRRRIDVLVDAGVLVAIENKVDSMEQRDQVKDYLEHLDYCTRGRSAGNVLIYLTPDGRPPESLSTMVLEKRKASGTLYCWSYLREFCDWLEACRTRCEAQKIVVFLTDFIAYIKSAMKRETAYIEEEEENEK
jgi:hypothetical protein